MEGSLLVMSQVVKMRKCRKCGKNKVIESRKWCDECKIAPQTCTCGVTFRSKKHTLCKLCRLSKGNDGICVVCNKHRHIKSNTGLCTTCYRFTCKYKLGIEDLIELRSITKCQICGDEVSHHVGNEKGRAVIDHDHATGEVRGVLCVNCNCIEGYIRDAEHLKSFYENYEKYMGCKKW